MAKTLGATTAARAARATLAPVMLVRLRTYSDRSVPTLDRTFYFSTGPGARYQWSGEGSAQNHDPLVAEIGDLEVSIPHIPSGDERDVPSKRLRIDLLNATFEGSRLASVLRAKTLEMARVDVAQVLLAGPPEAPFLDLTAEESVVWYRGVVRRWGPISDESIPLDCETEFPNLSWTVSTNVEESQPEDVGRRYPLTHGTATRVPAIGRKVGWVTTLAEKIDTSSNTTLEVTDASGFGDTGSAFLGSEKITWTGKSGNQLTGVTRGADATTKASHVAGDALVEVGDGATWSVSGRAVSSIDELHVANPFNGEIVRVTTPYTKTVSDTTTDTPTTATVAFSGGELEDLVQELSQSAEAQDVGGAVSWTVEQHPDAQYCDSSITTNAAIHRRYAPIDGLSMASRTNKGSFEITGSQWYSCGFAERAPFSRLKRQRLRAYVRRTSGSGALIVKSSALAAASGTTTYTSGVDWTATTDGIITIDTTVGEAGATDSRWWFESPAGSTWEVYEVWRLLDANDVGTYSETQKTLGSFELRNRDTGGLVFTTFAAHVQDADFDSGMSCGTDVDYGFRSEVTGGFEAKLYRLEIAVGNATGSYATTGQDGRSTWIQPMHIDHVGSLSAIGNAGNGSADAGTFMVGDTDTDGDAWGGLFDMDGAGYTAGFATGAASKFVFWIDGGLAQAAGHDVLEIRVRSSDGDDLLIEVDLYEIVDDGAPSASVAVQAANVGYGLKVFGSCSGPPAPSASPAYKIGAGNPIADAADVLRHFIEVEGGGTVESSSYDDTHDAMQNPNFQYGNDNTLTSGGVTAAAGQFGILADLHPDIDGERVLIQCESELAAGTMSDPGPGVTFAARGVLGTTAASHGNVAVAFKVLDAATLLNGALSDSATTITVDSTTGFASSGEIFIDDERITYTGTTATTFTGCTRGANGTTAAAHADNDWVWAYPSGLGVTLNGDLRPLGLTWREVAAGLGAECGVNLVPVETATGTEWRMLCPDVDGNFPAATTTITEWEPGGFVELGRDVRADVVTRAVYLYDADASLGSGDSVFRGALRTSPDAADHDLTSPAATEISALEDKIGRLDASSPVPFYLLASRDDADYIAGRNLSDRLRLPRLVAIAGVPWWQAYAIEVGDITQATPPWESALIKLRVIGFRKRTRDELVDLTAVEVT